MRQLTYPGLGSALLGLAATAINNSLYISDTSNNLMHRVDLSVISPVSVVTWTVPGSPYGLSATSTGNVLVTIISSSINAIIEYSPGGSLVRQVNTDINPRQAVELNNDVWAFVLKNPVNKLCTVLSKTGTLIKCFGSSGITRLNTPTSIGIDSHGYFLVTDNGNNRVLVVDPSLTVVRQLQLPDVYPAVQLPRSLILDQSRGRLYIGEQGGQYRVLVFEGIVWNMIEPWTYSLWLHLLILCNLSDWTWLWVMLMVLIHLSVCLVGLLVIGWINMLHRLKTASSQASAYAVRIHGTFSYILKIFIFITVSYIKHNFITMKPMEQTLF